MSDEPKVVAEIRATGATLDDDGNVKDCNGKLYKPSPWELALFLADLYRRVRGELRLERDQRNLDLETRLAERIEAAEASTRAVGRTCITGPNNNQGLSDRLDALSDRLKAVERGVRAVDGAERSRCEMEGTTLWPLIYGFADRLSALEARQQDEAGEGAKSGNPDYEAGLRQGHYEKAQEAIEAHCLGYEQCVFDDEKRTRRETAQEIVSWARDNGWPSLARHIEREFGGVEAKQESTNSEIETGDGWAVHRHVADAIRSEVSQEIASWLRNRYAYTGSSEKAKHASGVIMGAASQVERGYYK